MDELIMSQYAQGETLYVVRSGMPDLINRQVLVVGNGRDDRMTEVECIGDWSFPHGEKRAQVAEANLSRIRKAG
ncbi:hypothetical protein LMG28727_04877 [Paraburkholderia kirstenboschensis]|nr:hypothetical protein LMG28727_04877 [Paraburkholderia kirstenboschensis]